nr:hypothetical protein [Oceanococcus sp. HetDA_MAG_MS8]
MTSTTSSSAPPQPRGRRRFLLIAAIFFTPFFLAWLLYFGPEEWRPHGQTNNGEMLLPIAPVDLPLQDLQGQVLADPWNEKWTLLQVLPSECDQACESRLIDIRQLRKSLHRKRSRVQRLVVLPDAGSARALKSRLEQEHPLLEYAVLSASQHAQLRQRLQGDDPLTVTIIDPLGNAVMRYSPQKVDLRGLYDDLKRLLKLSNIG